MALYRERKRGPYFEESTVQDSLRELRSQQCWSYHVCKAQSKNHLQEAWGGPRSSKA